MNNRESSIVLGGFTVLFLLAETLIHSGYIFVSLFIYSVILQSLILYCAHRWGAIQSRLIVLMLPSVIRLVEFSLPLEKLSQPFALLVVSAPLALTAVSLSRLLKQGDLALSFEFHKSNRYILAIATGVLAGYILKFLRPAAPWGEASFFLTGFYAFVALIPLALLEEWLYRNIMQTALANIFGRRLAVLHVSLVYAFFHFDGRFSLFFIAVFLISIASGLLRAESDDLTEAFIFHGIANLVYFIFS